MSLVFFFYVQHVFQFYILFLTTINENFTWHSLLIVLPKNSLLVGKKKKKNGKFYDTSKILSV